MYSILDLYYLCYCLLLAYIGELCASMLYHKSFNPYVTKPGRPIIPLHMVMINIMQFMVDFNAWTIIS